MLPVLSIAYSMSILSSTTVYQSKASNKCVELVTVCAIKTKMLLLFLAANTARIVIQQYVIFRHLIYFALVFIQHEAKIRQIQGDNHGQRTN